MGEALEAEQRSCPTAGQLAAFLCDDLPPTAMDEIGAHVSSCRHCDDALRRMDEATNATFLALRKHLKSGARAGTPTDPEYLRMMAAAHAISPTQVLAVPPPQIVPPPAQLGQYRIGQRLGQGGMGAVYRAEHVRLKKNVAVKVLASSQMSDPRAVARFQLEMEVVGRLDHPNIVRATDAGEAEGIHFLVMELIDGVNLSHLLLRCGPLPVPEACELVRQAAVGLQHAHEHGLVHRDVKPSNLMLSATGQVKLLDLGLALLRANGPAVGDLTGVGEIMGTAEYMAPEQWAETHSVDIRADIYSLGCTLYTLLTGDPPFTGSGLKSFLRMMLAHQQQPVRPITDQRPDVPAALCELLDRMLAKNPDGRPAAPGEVAAALAPLASGANLSGLAVSAAPGAKTFADRLALVRPTLTPTSPVRTVSSPAPANGTERRGRRLLVAALAVVVIAAGASAYFAATAPSKNRATAPPNNEPPDPKKWRNLLAERPGERLWIPADESLLDYKADKEVLSVQTQRSALLRLGETPATGYKLQVGLKQIRWHGGIGVYFGGRAGADSNVFAFQLIYLCHTKAGKGREFALVRARGEFPLEPNTRPDVALTGFATNFLPPLDNGEQLLELEIRPNGLAVVRWDGSACPELVNEKATGAAQRLFPGAPFAGEFGIYCNGATVTVSTARYVPIE